LGCEVVGAVAVVGDVVVGCGWMMIGDFGGPCPVPSCAIVMAVVVDAMTKKATMAYFISALLGRSKTRRW
jgi:hypothetical protein